MAERRRDTERAAVTAGSTRVAATFPAGFVDGVRHFNAGRFYEAHEAFEALLDAVESDGRWDLLVALVQVAVGYHKWDAGHAGAARMLALGFDKLGAFPPSAWHVRIDLLRARIAADLEALAGASPPLAPPAPPPAIRLDGRAAPR